MEVIAGCRELQRSAMEAEILTFHFSTSPSTLIQGMHYDNYRRMIGLVKDSMCTRHTEHHSFLHGSIELCPSDQV